MITFPKEDIELKMRKTAIFRCKNTDSGKIENPPPEEVLTLFQKGRDDVVFCRRGQRSGTLEFFFFLWTKVQHMQYRLLLLKEDGGFSGEEGGAGSHRCCPSLPLT